MSEDKRKKPLDVSIGMIYGLIIGAIAGMILYDNPAYGAGIGMCLGILIASIIQIMHKKKADSQQE
jgi:tetrahydromethanopterin S-methyltransferase subunit G